MNSHKNTHSRLADLLISCCLNTDFAKIFYTFGVDSSHCIFVRGEMQVHVTVSKFKNISKVLIASFPCTMYSENS